MQNLHKLTSISRDGDQYFVCYNWQEVNNVTISLPVYTGGLTPRGAPAVSRTFCATSVVKRVRDAGERVRISCEQARELFELAVMYGLTNPRPENLGDKKWVARIRAD